MAKLTLTTDKGAVIASMNSTDGSINLLPSGDVVTPVSGLNVNNVKQCDDGAITLDTNYNTYMVKPSGSVSLTITPGAIADTAGCRFLLALDFSSGVQSVTLPENFRWNGDTPTMAGNGIHTVDVVYMSTEKVNAFTGTYLGRVANPIDMDGIVVRRRDNNQSDGELELVEDLCALEYNNLSLDTYVGYEDDEGNWQEDTYDYSVSVGPKGVVFGTLGCSDGTGGGESGTIELSLNGGTINSIQHGDATTSLTITSGYLGSANFTVSSSPNTVIMNGGTISHWLSFADCEVSASISDGYVQSISTSFTQGSVNISGGTFGDVSCSSCSGDMSCNITGGTIGTVNGEDCSDMSLTIQGTAHVGEIPYSYQASFSIGGDATVDVVRAGEESSVTMSGGTVGEFYAGGNCEWMNLTMSGGTIGTLYVATPQSCGVVNVTGGYIGSIETAPENLGIIEPTTPGPFSNCTIGKISTYPSSDAELEFEADAIIPSIGANVTVERFEFLVPYAEGYTYGTINVGANSIIKLAPSAQAYRTAGALVINADPTAQIINLED